MTKMKELFIKLKNNILEGVFPSDYTCILCDKEIPDGDICPSCKKQDIFNTGNRCKVCDMVIKEGNVICDHCKSHPKSFEKAYCALKYNDATKSSILKFKNDSAKYLAPKFAKLMFDCLQKENVDFDIILPVPSHEKSVKKRGYNPALLLAEELGKLTEKPVYEVLTKNVQTQNQKFLNFQQRQTNLENSITLSDLKVIKGKRVLIVDDILTTGATVNACAKLLGKAKSVLVCTLARRNI